MVTHVMKSSKTQINFTVGWKTLLSTENVFFTLEKQDDCLQKIIVEWTRQRAAIHNAIDPVITASKQTFTLMTLHVALRWANCLNLDHSHSVIMPFRKREIFGGYDDLEQPERYLTCLPHEVNFFWLSLKSKIYLFLGIGG